MTALLQKVRKEFIVQCAYHQECCDKATQHGAALIWHQAQNVIAVIEMPDLEAEIAALERDAARYRHLRDRAINSDAGPWCVTWDGVSPQSNDNHPCDGEELDIEIDAAIAAAARGKGET